MMRILSIACLGFQVASAHKVFNHKMFLGESTSKEPQCPQACKDCKQHDDACRMQNCSAEGLRDVKPALSGDALCAAYVSKGYHACSQSENAYTGGQQRMDSVDAFACETGPLKFCSAELDDAPHYRCGKYSACGGAECATGFSCNADKECEPKEL